jgi:hypothetical protein
MAKLTRRSLLRNSFGLVAAGTLAHPYIANAAATTAAMWCGDLAPIVQSGTGSSSAAISPATTRMRMIQAIFWNSIKGACDKEGWLKDLGTVEERCDFPIWVDVPIPVDWAAKARLLEFDPRKAGSADDIGQRDTPD